MNSIMWWNEWMVKRLAMQIMLNNWAVYIFGIDSNHSEDVDETLDSLTDDWGTTMDSISNLLKYTNDYLLINHKFNDEFGFSKETGLTTKN